MDPMRLDVSARGGARVNRGVQAGVGRPDDSAPVPSPTDGYGGPSVAAAPEVQQGKPAVPSGSIATTAVIGGMCAPAPVSVAGFKWVEGPLTRSMREAIENGGFLVFDEPFPKADPGVLERFNDLLQGGSVTLDRNPPVHANADFQRFDLVGSHPQDVQNDGSKFILRGSTGTGKASVVRETARELGLEMRTIDLSRETDASELFGDQGNVK